MQERSSRMEAAAAPSGPAPAPRRAPFLDLPLPSLSPRGWALLGLNLVLAAVAYRSLLLGESKAPLPLEKELENWFFYASHNVPWVVLVLAAWLLYRRADRLARLDPRPAPAWLWGGLLLLGTSLLVWATRTDALDLTALSLMLQGFGLAALFGGVPAMRAVLVPVGFLVFAVTLPAPLLNAVLFRFQVWTAELTGLWLHLLDVPAFVSGDQILMADEHFAIVENCSGMRSVETLTMLTVLLVDLFRRNGWHAAILLLCAPFAAFLLNSFRALTLILNPASEIVEIHNLQGVAILLAGLTGIYLLDGLLDRWLPRRKSAQPPGPARSPQDGPAPGGRWRGLVATGALALAALASLVVPDWTAPETPYPKIGDHWFSELGRWTSQTLQVDWGYLGRTGFRAYVHRRYRSGPEVVDLFAGIGDRSQRLTSAVSPKTHFPGSGWIIEYVGRGRLGEDGPEVDAMVLRSETRRILVYHWVTHWGGLLEETARTFLALDETPWRRPDAPVSFRLSTRVAGTEPEARREAEERLLRFYEAARPSLDRL